MYNENHKNKILFTLLFIHNLFSVNQFTICTLYGQIDIVTCSWVLSFIKLKSSWKQLVH